MRSTNIQAASNMEQSTMGAILNKLLINIEELIGFSVQWYTPVKAALLITMGLA
jgi:hypothetical protein